MTENEILIHELARSSDEGMQCKIAFSFELLRATGLDLCNCSSKKYYRTFMGAIQLPTHQKWLFFLSFHTN